MNAKDELRHLAGEADAEPLPPGFELDELTFPGAEEDLVRAREVMSAVLTGVALPAWFAAMSG